MGAQIASVWARYLELIYEDSDGIEFVILALLLHGCSIILAIKGVRSGWPSVRPLDANRAGGRDAVLRKVSGGIKSRWWWGWWSVVEGGGDGEAEWTTVLKGRV